MSEPHQLEEAIFEAARYLPAVHRPGYVERACGADTELFQRVQRRLAAAPTTAPLANGNGKPKPETTPAPSPDSEETIGATIVSGGTLPRMGEESPGDWIGRYQLVEKIGEGGFGVVYMAEQKEPVIRRVALKITKLGMDTKQVIARFEAERQALALMNHPHIANVIDGGATETGRPFFVMELVRGIKITEYCDQNNVPLRKRLSLFIQVCQAIEHAHQNGIIHRDIKPSNILVTLHDGVPSVKVIDFGIAKATQGTLTDKTVFTQFDQFIGTPAYMSPEQAEMSGAELDQRSDIYSLGVLLYELLTGHTPFESKGLLARGFDEMRRIIREIEPLRPSNRLVKETGDELRTKAISHGTEAPKLISLIRGDLDWVVMKCLEKDRTRRYDSAAKLSKEIQRFLTNQPVIARPPSHFYRFQKLVMRNRLAFGAGTVFFTSLFVGLCVTTYYVIKEKDARDYADNASKGAETARQTAEAARNKAQAALQLSEQERVSAEGARLKAEAALKEAQSARLEAESALQQSLEDRKKAQAADQKARTSQNQAEAAETRATSAVGKSEEAIRAAATESALRQRAEAAEAAAVAKAANLDTAISNIIARLSALPPSDALKASAYFFTAADEKQPWAAQFLRRRGEWRARQGDWTNAIQDFSKVLDLDLGDVDSYQALAPLLIQDDNWDAYASLRNLYQARFGGTKDPTGAVLFATEWLMKPLPLSSLATAQPPAPSGPSAGKTSAIAVGLAEYRRGHYDASLDLTLKAVTGVPETSPVAAQAAAVIAMSQLALKQTEEARATWAKAEKAAEAPITKLGGGDPGPDWRQWILARALLQEAAGLILPAIPATPTK